MFKAMMNDIFADIQKVVIVYIDNILVFTKTNDEKKHNCTILEVLWQLEENNLFIKPEKCMFKIKEIDFLGMIITVMISIFCSTNLALFL